MILINIAIFLIIAALFISVYKPKSKSDAWLFSIIIPIVVYFWFLPFTGCFIFQTQTPAVSSPLL